jgi:hypothetical protein
MQIPSRERTKFRWPTGPRARIAAEAALIGLLSIVATGFGIESAGIATGPPDPLLSYAAIDEAVYAHAAARMVRTGHVATSIFLDRLLLNKPPLLMWTGAASMRLFGMSPLALRFPILLAGAGCCVLLYLWLRRSRPPAAAFAGVILLLSAPLFHTVARRFTTDILLTVLLVAALFVLSRDPRFELRWSPVWFGLLSGTAIMTKSAAGVLPLLVLCGYWLLAGKASRPALARVAIACAVAAAVAAPWHLYQFIAHRQWFLSEYLGVQLFQVGLSEPSTRGQTVPFYYLRAMLKTDPLLLLLSLTALPGLVAAWRREERAQARLLGVWILIVCAGLAVFGNRAAYYLAPLLPALALAVGHFSPLMRSRAAPIACAALLAVFAVKVQAGDRAWGLAYVPASSPDRAALDDYSRLRRANELVLLEPNDQCYAALLDLPKIRYAFVMPKINYRMTPRFLYHLGIIVSENEFCERPGALSVYAQRLEAWHAPPGSVATVIMARSQSELANLIHSSPDRDFSLPEDLRDLALQAAGDTHRATAAEGGRLFLLAVKSSRRTDATPAPGTLAGTY